MLRVAWLAALLRDRIHKELGNVLILVRLLILGVCCFMGLKLIAILIEKGYCLTNKMIGGVTLLEDIRCRFLFKCWRL